jgi:hypothetical protein
MRVGSSGDLTVSPGFMSISRSRGQNQTTEVRKWEWLFIGLSRKLLLVLASIVNLGLGSRRNSWLYFCSIQGIFYVLKLGLLFDDIRGSDYYSSFPFYWWWLDWLSGKVVWTVAGPRQHSYSRFLVPQDLWPLFCSNAEIHIYILRIERYKYYLCKERLKMLIIN